MAALDVCDRRRDRLFVVGAGQLLRAAQPQEVQKSLAYQLPGLCGRAGVDDLGVVGDYELRRGEQFGEVLLDLGFHVGFGGVSVQELLQGEEVHLVLVLFVVLQRYVDDFSQLQCVLVCNQIPQNGFQIVENLRIEHLILTHNRIPLGFDLRHKEVILKLEQILQIYRRFNPQSTLHNLDIPFFSDLRSLHQLDDIFNRPIRVVVLAHVFEKVIAGELLDLVEFVIVEERENLVAEVLVVLLLGWEDIIGVLLLVVVEDL